MNYYILRLKSDDTRVDRAKASNLEDAITFFIKRKQLDRDTFNKLYKVSEDK